MKIEVEVRGYFPKGEERQAILNRIYTFHGEPKISDEAVVFFKYKSDVRIKLNREGLLFTVKKSVEKEKKHYSRKEYKVLIPLNKAEDFIKRCFTTWDMRKACFLPIQSMNLRLESIAW